MNLRRKISCKCCNITINRREIHTAKYLESRCAEEIRNIIVNLTKNTKIIRLKSIMIIIDSCSNISNCLSC